MRKPKSKARKDRERRERMLRRGLQLNDKNIVKGGAVYINPASIISSTWFPFLPSAKGSSTPTRRSRRSRKNTAPASAGGASASRSTHTTELEF